MYVFDYQLITAENMLFLYWLKAFFEDFVSI